MENNAGTSVQGPLEDYRSALAKAKLLAVEESTRRTRQRQAENQRLPTERTGRAPSDITPSLGQRPGTSIMLPSLQDETGVVVVKQEHGIDLLNPKDIPKSSRLHEAPKSNQYTSLVSTKRRKQEEHSPDPGHATVRHAAEQGPALLNRPFAPRKKPVRGARPLYDNVRLLDTRTTRHSSEWYERIDMKQKFARSDLESLKYLKSLIRSCEERTREGDASKEDHSELQSTFFKLRRRIHQMEFYDFLSGVLVRTSKLLEDGGLPSIFNGSNGVQYPWDIRADSLSLYQRWLAGVIDPHLLRGIETKTNRAANGKETKSRCLQKDYENRVSCNYIGAGHLQNGQWWPLQICALRDGAHGEIEGGIHGQPGKGAYSVVLSSGGYADEDSGSTVQYCGTAGVDAKPSAGTLHLKDSCKHKTSVRVLRSSALPAPNPYRPAKGVRYDGLYHVVKYEILDAETAMHRFTLSRCDGQESIRCQGVEKRPTDEELAEYSKIRALLGLAA